MTYVVENITSKSVNTKFGPKNAYTINANGERFSFGFKKPTFAIGDTIDFQYTENDYGKQIDDKSVRTIAKGDGGAAPAPAPAAVSGGSAPARSYGAPAKVFPIPPLSGERAIVRQNSITNSTKLVTETMAARKGTADLEEMAKAIVSIARVFEEYSCGDEEAAAAEAIAKGE